MFLLVDSKIERDFVISVSAIVVSITGIGLGVYYNWKNLKNTKKHNKKTVEPLLNLSVELTAENGHLIYLNNLGLGPAILISIDFVFEEKSYKNLVELQMNHYMDCILNMNEEQSQNTIIVKGGIIGVGEEIRMHKLIFKNEFNTGSFLDFLRKTSIKVEYSNLYGDLKVLQERLMI